ncbi:MAG: NAD(P)/FAD-dependent oxidoreductase [Mycobacterium sp.]|nr:NAD(P)/FAD-dependent oxidoreductase [Mycobacterium sp.]
MRDVSMAVVGAGFGGIAAAVRAREAGVRNLVIIEREARVGGVWEANSYPGLACDVPSNLYSFSFAPNPRWSRRFAPQAEIRAYLERVARDQGLESHLRLGTEVRTATWDDAAGRWRLDLAGGEVVEAELLVTACGQLARPRIPDVPGLADFPGPAFHSSDWNHDLDLTGLRVAVLGTGASAIQFVPAIAGRTRALTIFQRSAPWTLPKTDVAYSARTQRIFERFPWLQRASRSAWRTCFELLAPLFTGRPPRAADRARRLFAHLSNLQRDMALRGDRDLRNRVQPDYEMGCKRVLLTSDWLPTLRRPNVELVTDGVARVTGEGIVDTRGRTHPADAIIFGTGYAATDLLAPMEVLGRGGERLHDRWRDGAEAYLGLSVPGFPNLFMVYGPNTGHGTGSAIDMLEAQAEHIADAVRLLADGRAEQLEVRREVFDAFRREIAERMADTVWASGCGSWYRNDAGRVTITWPGQPAEYQRRARRLSAADYELRAPAGSSFGPLA